MPETHRFMEMPAGVLSSLQEKEISRLYLEICSDGFVTRELGVDGSGAVTHRAPTESNPYCLSGGRRVEYETVDDQAVRLLFDRLWHQDPEEVIGQ